MAKPPVGAALRGRLDTSPSALTTTAGSVHSFDDEDAFDPTEFIDEDDEF
jgi:hypothetical protein